MPEGDAERSVSETARTRPLAVTIIGWLFVATGILPGSVLVHERSGRGSDIAWAAASAIVALAGGALLLRGVGWARPILLCWLALHVVLSVAHGMGSAAFHATLLIAIGVLLFRRPNSAYFAGGMLSSSRSSTGP